MRTIRVVAGVIVRDGLILICQRRKGDSHELQWEFPGGKVESGEEPEEALVRELREELGIEAAIGPLLEATQVAYPNRSPIELMFYRVASFRGEPRNLVFERIEWCAPEALPAYDFLEGDRDFVRRLAAGEHFS
jgi:8-oxo-dGTP diphosphatase